MSKEELFEKAKDSILEIDEDMAAEVLEEAKAEGVTALELLQEGFSVGMNEIGERYARNLYLLPML